METKINAKQMQEERTKAFEDVSRNIIPSRVPIKVNLTFEAVAQFGGLDLKEAQWNPKMLKDSARNICDTVYSDICPAGLYGKFPAQYETSQSQAYRMGKNGFMQHPEVVGMHPEDYDYLIEHPWECLMERVLARQYKALDPSDPITFAISLAKTILASNADGAELRGFNESLHEMYGYYKPDVRASGTTGAPMDFLADQLRSFSGISADIRRIPGKVLAAINSLYPILLKTGMPAIVNDLSRAVTYLHMPTFMREADFAKLWWPSFLQMCNEYASLGIGTDSFIEDDWMRYLDYLQDLPANSILKFEYGDMRTTKEKLGKRHILTGFYPMSILKTNTKQQCVDKAKEMVDVLAPGGKFIFSFDKVVITAGSINLDNLIAVTEYIRDNTAYDNAGQTAGDPFREQDYRVEPSKEFRSKYYMNASDYKKRNPELSDFAANKLEGYDKILFNFLSRLLF